MAFNHTTNVSSSYNESLVRFLKTVFNYMSGGLALAGLTAYVTLHNEALFLFALKANFILAPAWMFSGWFIYKIIEKASITGGIITFVIYSIATGLTFAPIALVYTSSNITTALIVTSVLFAATSLFGLSSKKSLSSWDLGLRMCGLGLLGAIIIHFILSLFGMATQGFGIFLSFLIVPFIAVAVAFEINQLKELHYMYEGEDKQRLAIIGATQLFSSFVVMFLHILRILGFLSSSD